MASALEIQPGVLAEAAKTREAFTETHGPSIQEGDVHYHEKSFRGTGQDIQKLQALAQTPAFQNMYPDHYVYADGNEIIGSFPRPFPKGGIEPYRQAISILHQVAAERGITLHNCAIIITGPEGIESSL